MLKILCEFCQFGKSRYETFARIKQVSYQIVVQLTVFYHFIFSHYCFWSQYSKFFCGYYLLVLLFVVGFYMSFNGLYW